MKKTIILYLQLSLLPVGLVAQEGEFNYHADFGNILAMTQNPESELHYDKQIVRFHSNDKTLTDYEVLALLIGFTAKNVFRPYAYLEVEREIYSLNAVGQFQEAMELSDSLLASIPFSAMALLEKSYSHHKLGNEDSASFYTWKFTKIVNAMASTGNGLTPETAMFSLGPSDGQILIRRVLRGRIGVMGSGRDANGNFIDILEAILTDEESGEEFNATLYFQIQHATSTMFKDVLVSPEDESEASKQPGSRKKKKRRSKKDKN